MELLLMGTGMGIVGGLIPSPLHLIALSQVALNRWLRALAILVGLPLLIDGALLLVTLFFFQYVPRGVAHGAAYLGGMALVAFGGYSMLQKQRKTDEQLAQSATLTSAGVSAAIIAELTAPGTWVYWLTIAGPILDQGKRQGYWHVVPFFAGGLIGYYGASIFSVWLMALGASLHRAFKQRLFFLANLLLVVLGVFYLFRAITEAQGAPIDRSVHFLINSRFENNFVVVSAFPSARRIEIQEVPFVRAS